MKLFLKYRWLNRWIYYIVGVFCVAWFSFSSYEFFTATNHFEVNQLEATLETVANNNARSVEFAFEKYINYIEVSAEYINNSNLEGQELEKIMGDLVKTENFYKIVVIMPEEVGVSFESDGSNFSISEYVYEDAMNSRETYVSDLFYDGDIPVVSVNVPVFDEEGMLSAYISGVLSTEEISSSFHENMYNIGGYFHVIDGNGNYIALSDGGNELLNTDVSFFEGINSMTFENGYSADMVIEAFEERGEGLIKYNNSGSEARTAYFAPIQINNWLMYSVVNQDDIAKNVRLNIISAIVYILCIGVIIALFAFLVNKSQKKYLNAALESERKFRIVSDYINKFFLELDFENNEIKFIGNYQDVLDRDKSVNSIQDDLRDGFIYPEDVPLVNQCIKEVKMGKSVLGKRIRVRRANGKYMWSALTAIPLDPPKNMRITKAIGLLEDVDTIMNETMNLKKKSEVDALSQLYNKGACEYLIKDSISKTDLGKSRHIFFIIDLDNFKNINDSFGHSFGDDVIVEMAGVLKSMFRYEDIVGRIGGDEFVAFMQNVHYDEQIVKRAALICKELNKTYTKDGHSVTISASVGISMYPKDGIDFETLYRNADVALYDVKSHGKGTYKMYEGQVNSNYVSKRTVVESDLNEPMLPEIKE